MNQEQLEQTVISSIKTFDDLNILREGGITENSFVFFPEIFEFIGDYSREYDGKVPSKEIIESQFDPFKIVETNGDTEWYIKKLSEAELSRAIGNVLEEGVRLLMEEKRPGDALDYIVSGLNENRSGKKMNLSSTDGDAIKRLDQYLQRAKEYREGGLPGIPTGIKFLDDNNVSWLPGQLIGVIASTKKGKSWLSLYLACIAYALGKRVIFFSPELSIPEVEARWDTIMSKIMGCEFSNMSLLMGHHIDVNSYKDWLETVSKRSDWLTITSDSFRKPLTIDAVESQVHRFNPDVVVVDGIYLLKSSNKKADNWEKIMDITYGLKSLATSRNVVVIASNQLQRGAADKENPDLNEVGYSWAFAQTVDKCLIISKPERTVSDNIRVIRLTGVRSGVDLDPQEVIWDVDIGIIGHSIS